MLEVDVCERHAKQGDHDPQDLVPLESHLCFLGTFYALFPAHFNIHSKVEDRFQGQAFRPINSVQLPFIHLVNDRGLRTSHEFSLPLKEGRGGLLLGASCLQSHGMSLQMPSHL
jgi:hypothetical protein